MSITKLFKDTYTEEKIKLLFTPFEKMTKEEQEQYQKENRQARGQGADEEYDE